MPSSSFVRFVISPNSNIQCQYKAYQQTHLMLSYPIGQPLGYIAERWGFFTLSGNPLIKWRFVIVCSLAKRAVLVCNAPSAPVNCQLTHVVPLYYCPLAPFTLPDIGLRWLVCFTTSKAIPNGKQSCMDKRWMHANWICTSIRVWFSALTFHSSW